jgi:transposase-like protein
VCRDGLKGLPDAIGEVWPQAIVQTCIVHLLRASFRYASRKYWPQIAKHLRPVYQAPSEQAALDAFAEFAKTWESRYPAIVRLWENAWAEFVPFLRFDPRSAASSAPQTPSRASTPGSGGRCGPAATSPTTKRR